jgi:hypothetical protein
MNSPFKYFAFISYNSKDTEWGKKLQKKLEHYKLPATLCSEHGWTRTPIKPVFFAPTDIQPGGLSEELQERLKASQHLIVICSPNSAKSEWVGREIEFFHGLGRSNNIHFFIVDGTPHSGNPDTECFNPIIDKLGLPEILGANINEKVSRLPWLNKERAYVQLISKLLGVEFDSIWQRHKRLLFRKTVAWTVGSIAVIAAMIAIGSISKPFDADLKLEEASQNAQLPPMKDAIVTLTLDNETKTDTLSSFEAITTFSNIPHRYLSQPVQITVSCRDFLDIDTVLTLTKSNVLSLFRDPTVYGDIHFTLYNIEDEAPMSGVTLMIEGQEVVSDENGRVALSLPLDVQKKAYPIKTDVALLNDSIFMPCGENDVVLVK